MTGELDIARFADGEREGDYRIGHGDIFDIRFLYNPEYNVSEIRVRPDGKIELPYAGEISVTGLTPSELDSIVTERYERILRGPDVSIILRNFSASVVYMLGEVRSPGAYKIERSLTLLGALSKAQGLEESASKGSVLVIRRVAQDRIVGMQFDIDELLDEGRFDLDIPLKPNDIVYVPKSRLHKAEEFVSVVFGILEKPADLYLKGWQVSQVKWLYEFYRVTAQGR